MDSASARNEINKFTAGRKSVGDYTTQYEKELGGDASRARGNDLLSLVRNTESAIKGVGASVSGRTQGSLVNEAQRARLVNMETAPLTDQFSAQSNAYGDEQANYRDIISRAQARGAGAYQTDADMLSALENNYSRAFTEEQARAAAAESARQARAQEAMVASLNTPAYNPTVDTPTPAAANVPLTDARERASRILSGDINAQAASYKGLLGAASRGDAVAKQTLIHLDQAKPGLKKSYMNIVAQGGNVGYAPTQTPKSIVPSWVSRVTKSNYNPVGAASNLVRKWWNG